jgi:iron complex outermembrane receptor protein
MAIGVALPEPVMAQQLEEVTVTARRRGENVQDVPIAITVITESEIARANIEQVADFVKLVPNVTFDNALNLGTNFLTIRGQTQSQYAPPPVAIVVDGVTTISPLQFNADEFDLRQIEVLKGPQGALYGRNAIAGAINLTTREPGNTFEGRYLVGYGRGEELRLRAWTSGPIIADKLAASVGFSYTDRGGQVRNITTGENVDRYDDVTGQMRVIAKPSDSLSVDFKYRYSSTHGYDPAYITSRSRNPRVNDDPIDANRKGENPRILQDASVKADWTTNLGTATAILAYMHVREDVSPDFDFSPLDIIRVAQHEREYGISQEFRFASPRSDRLRWLVGTYHVRSTRGLGAEIYVDPFYFGLTPRPTSANFQLSRTFDVNKYENYSGFGQIEYDLAPTLELAMALRYDSDTNQQNGVRDAAFRKLQPKGTLTWKPERGLVLYGSIGQGFRAGDFNAAAATFGSPVIQAESATTYEVGIKSQLLGQRLVANAAAFYTDLSNGQFKLFDAGGATNVGINIDSTRIYGFELETTAMISDELSLSAAVGYTSTEVEKFTPPPGYRGSTASYVGATPPRVPDYTINFAVNYERPLTGTLNLFAHGAYRRTGSFYWDLENKYRRDPVDDLDLRIGVRDPDGKWSVAAWAKNALNDRSTADYQPFTNSGHPLGIDAYYFAVGARYGVDLTYRF